MTIRFSKFVKFVGVGVVFSPPGQVDVPRLAIFRGADVHNLHLNRSSATFDGRTLSAGPPCLVEVALEIIHGFGWQEMRTFSPRQRVFLDGVYRYFKSEQIEK